MQTFRDSDLKEEIIKALDDLGFEKPTPIQAQTIPQILSSKQDLIALAQTGTGKTAAFSLPVLNQIDPQNKEVQAIILCPTRELCMQISKDIAAFTKHMGRVNVAAIYGGSSMDKQIRDLKSGAQIVAGTPGRVQDLINRKKLKINNIKWLILDEADEMMSMGFQEELDEILKETPKEKQTLLFSATMPKAIAGMTKKYMKDPVEISVGSKNEGAEKVNHVYYMVHARDRYKALRRIADVHPEIYGIIFCRTRRETQEVADKLAQDHYSAEAIHGDLSQQQRSQVMKRFRDQQTQFLVATDVAARGIDVKDLTHVINYNLPDSMSSYVHRSGRTGRAHQSGTSIAIIHMRELNKIRTIERMIKKQFQQKMIPSGSEICEKQLLNLVNKIDQIKVNDKQISPFIDQIMEKFAHLSREELIKHFISVEFSRFLAFYKDAPDLNTGVKSGKGGRERKGRDENVKFSSFTINAGSQSKMTKRDLMQLINKERSLRGVAIGQIDIHKDSTSFETDSRVDSKILRYFKQMQYHGTSIQIKMDKSGGNDGEHRPSGGGYRGGNRNGGGNRRRSSESSRGGYKGRKR